MVQHELHRERADMRFTIEYDKSFREYKEPCLTKQA